MSEAALEYAPITNPFGKSEPEPTTNAAALSDRERATQEVQAAMVIAKRFPRNPIQAMDKILAACTRPTLAERALYAYPRGGEVITGPSIRLAEALAQAWGNLQFGLRELSQGHGESTVEAYAWDIETNIRQTKTFTVPHKRYTKKKGLQKLDDPRDIYENVANQGARRMRACILGIIPGDVVETAVKQCEVTQANNVGVPEEQIKKLLEAFKALGVTKEMIVKRLGHRLDSVITAEILTLRKIYTSLTDGMSSVEDWFEKPDGAEAVNQVLQGKAGGESPPVPPGPATSPVRQAHDSGQA